MLVQPRFSDEKVLKWIKNNLQLTTSYDKLFSDNDYVIYFQCSGNMTVIKLHFYFKNYRIGNIIYYTSGFNNDIPIISNSEYYIKSSNDPSIVLVTRSEFIEKVIDIPELGEWLIWNIL